MTDDIITDFYIKLPSADAMPTALAAFYQQDMSTVVDPDTGEEHVQIEGDAYLVSTTHDYAIDLVGVIYEPTGETLTDDEGNEYPATAPLNGWHLNIRLLNDTMRAETEALDAQYGVTPNSPSRVWA
jgi:hypothetical protein